MKNLGNLSPALGSNKTTKRKGRGIGSGLGKTAGKGHKGQRARKSGNVRPGFEGGQTPMYRRLPKFGFTNLRTKVQFSLVQVGDLAAFKDGSVVDVKSLKAAGLIRKAHLPVKILGTGKLACKLTIRGAKVTNGARQAIESVGGKVVVEPTATPEK